MVIIHKLILLQKLVAMQAEDPALWFQATCISESYLQSQLRFLHSAIESNNIEDIERMLQKLEEQQKCG